jgi:hypothetical protein
MSGWRTASDVLCAKTACNRVRNKIEQLLPDGGDPSGPIQPTEALLASLPQLEKELQDQVKLQQAVAPPTPDPSLPPDPHPTTASAFAAIVSSEHKYTEIKVPCLAFFAVPHDMSRVFPGDAALHAAVAAADLERQTRLANAFEAGVPSATVIRLPNADHYIFRQRSRSAARHERLPRQAASIVIIDPVKGQTRFMRQTGLVLLGDSF